MEKGCYVGVDYDAVAPASNAQSGTNTTNLKKIRKPSSRRRPRSRGDENVQGARQHVASKQDENIGKIRERSYARDSRALQDITTRQNNVNYNFEDKQCLKPSNNAENDDNYSMQMQPLSILSDIEENICKLMIHHGDGSENRVKDFS